METFLTLWTELSEKTLFNVAIIIVGFALLIQGADKLVLGASSLAKRMKISDLAIGLTIVAMGTSAPELVVNTVAGTADHADVLFGNIIGSNIFNTFFILGISSIIYPLTVQRSVLKKDIPYALVAVFFLFFALNDSFFLGFLGKTKNVLGMWDGVLLLGVFVAFLVHTFWRSRTESGAEEEAIETFGTTRTIFYLLIGMVALTLGGNFVVDHAVFIAERWGISDKIIGLTILAGGTSLPELATTSVAAFNKKPDLAVGNIIGSNIFNITLILGTSSLISYAAGKPVIFDPKMNFDLAFSLLGMFLMVVFVFTFKRKKIDPVEGAIFLGLFVSYFYYLYTQL